MSNTFPTPTLTCLAMATSALAALSPPFGPLMNLPNGLHPKSISWKFGFTGIWIGALAGALVGGIGVIVL